MKWVWDDGKVGRVVDDSNERRVVDDSDEVMCNERRERVVSVDDIKATKLTENKKRNSLFMDMITSKSSIPIIAQTPLWCPS